MKECQWHILKACGLLPEWVAWRDSRICVREAPDSNTNGNVTMNHGTLRAQSGQRTSRLILRRLRLILLQCCETFRARAVTSPDINHDWLISLAAQWTWSVFGDAITLVSHQYLISEVLLAYAKIRQLLLYPGSHDRVPYSMMGEGCAKNPRWQNTDSPTCFKRNRMSSALHVSLSLNIGIGNSIRATSLSRLNSRSSFRISPAKAQTRDHAALGNRKG